MQVSVSQVYGVGMGQVLPSLTGSSEDCISEILGDCDHGTIGRNAKTRY
jgi:hypothetical protein